MTTEDDRMRLLSDAERAAMEGDDYDPEEDNAAAQAEIGRGKLDEEEGVDEPGREAAASDGPADRKVAQEEGAPADEPSKDETEPAAPAAAPAPQGYTVDLPQDYDDQVKANRDAVRALRQKFADGDMDQGEYDSQLDELQERRDELRDMKTRATVSAEMRQQAERDTWINTIHAFMAEAAINPELGQVDYRKDAAKQADLDVFVKALGNAPENAERPMHWFLDEAHKRVLALHGISAARKPAAQVAQRQPDAAAIVTTLAGVPGGAGDADPVSDEFAELDKLTGLDYERALGLLSLEKRERYLRA